MNANRLQVLLHHVQPSLDESSPIHENYCKSSKYVIRLLEEGDFDKQFLPLLSQLTSVGNVSKEQFQKQLQLIQQYSPMHQIFVIENMETKQIVASATLIVELKFTHSCGKVAHIEDVVVQKTERGSRLGQQIVQRLLAEAKTQGCYKVILDCTDKNVPFYEKCGFIKKENQMRYDIH